MQLAYKNFKFSLKLKITLFFLSLVIVMMATVGYIFTIRELNLRKEQMTFRMERLANNIAAIRSVETEDWAVYQSYLDNQILVNPEVVYIAIFDNHARLKVHALNKEWLDLDSGRPLTRQEQSTIVSRLDQRQIAAESQRDFESKSVNIMVGQNHLGTVNIGFSLVELNDEMKKNIYRNLLLDAIFILLAVIIAFFIGSRIVNPLGKLTTAMNKISQGDFQQVLSITSHDEIGEMASTFNFMSRGLLEKQIIENFSRELGFTFELEKIAHLITREITAALGANHGLLFLARNHETPFELTSSYPEQGSTQMALHLDAKIVPLFLAERFPRPIKTLSAFADFLDQLNAIHETREEALITPLIIKDTLRGFFLICCPRRQSGYSQEEMQLLNTLLSQGSIAIENALLYEELTEQERLKKEIEIARHVQLSLLPQDNPRHPGLDIHGVCLPASEIGGDYYDFFNIDEHTLGIAIADVTGKGTSAAFYMAVLKGIMLSLTLIHTSPKKLLRELNRRILGNMDRKIFATMIYATIDTQKKVLTFARAGHNALLKRSAKDSRVEGFTPPGIGLGLADDRHFVRHTVEQTIPFEAGDVFVFYTDGISEAMNGAHAEYGEARLVESLSGMNDLTAVAINEKILSQNTAFAGREPQHDDITLVTVKSVRIERAKRNTG